MTRRISGELAYVLHRRPYRETSALVELLTLQHGCMSVVGRGLRGGSKRQATLQPFGRILIGCSGRGSLMTLTSVEAAGYRTLVGDALFAGLYLNELVLRLMKHDDAHPAVFVGYEAALDALMAGEDIESALRQFELLLLQESGYEINFEVDAHTQAPIEPTMTYRFEADVGFSKVDAVAEERAVYSGSTIAAIRAGDYSDPAVRRAAKRLMRRALAPHLGERPLRTRSLFAGKRVG